MCIWEGGRRGEDGNERRCRQKSLWGTNAGEGCGEGSLCTRRIDYLRFHTHTHTRTRPTRPNTRLDASAPASAVSLPTPQRMTHQWFVLGPLGLFCCPSVMHYPAGWLTAAVANAPPCTAFLEACEDGHGPHDCARLGEWAGVRDGSSGAEG